MAKKNKHGMIWMPLKQCWKKKCRRCKQWFFFVTYRRPPEYCSEACKQAAYRQRQATGANGIGPDVLK